MTSSWVVAIVFLALGVFVAVMAAVAIHRNGGPGGY